MSTCYLCPPGGDPLGDDVETMAEHLRTQHPDVYGGGPERWPDGTIVVYDTTLEPIDFGRPA